MSRSLYEQLGGEPALRAIIDDFVDRVFDDLMIGFMFKDVSKKRLKELEFQHAAELLGGPVAYRGRPLDRAHAKHRIMGGQFARRSQILRNVLAAHEAPEPVREAWLAHVESLRPLVTADPEGQCTDPRYAAVERDGTRTTER